MKRVFRIFVSTALLGFSIALPVGPIGLLVIHRTLARGPRWGLASGLGVALGDGTYAVAAAFGLTALSNLLIGLQTPIRLLGGLFLVYIAMRTLFSRPAMQAAPDSLDARPRYPAAVASAWALTVTNPLTILLFASLFTGAGLGLDGQSAGCAPFAVLGIVAGSLTWWCVLVAGAGLVRARLTAGVLVWLNRAAGVVLFIFAVRVLAGG